MDCFASLAMTARQSNKKPAVVGDGRLWFGMQEVLPPYATQRLLIFLEAADVKRPHKVT
jgi:hypothetical protein